MRTRDSRTNGTVVDSVIVKFGMKLLLPILLCGLANAKVIKFYIEPVQKTIPTYVTQLVEGKMQKIEQGVRQTASVSLVYDSGYYIVVDSPSATDVEAKSKMLAGISSRNLAAGHVQLVVTTHGHPDHFGQGNFFPNARHFFGTYEYSDDTYIKTELFTTDLMRITPNVQIWNTPGHTSQDISVVVHNVPCCGTVAVVGDLFYDEFDALNGTDWYADSWNPSVGKVNRMKMLCYADYIIPGHGKLFRVSAQMKKNAECVNNDILGKPAQPFAEIQGNSVVSAPLPTPPPEYIPNNVPQFNFDPKYVKLNDQSSTSTTTQFPHGTRKTAYPVLFDTSSVITTSEPEMELPEITTPQSPAQTTSANLTPVTLPYVTLHITPEPRMINENPTSNNIHKDSTVNVAGQGYALPIMPTIGSYLASEPFTSFVDFLQGENHFKQDVTSLTDGKMNEDLTPTNTNMPEQITDTKQLTQAVQQLQQHFDPETANSHILPVVESAASQLARALNVQVDEKNKEYPFTEYWKKTFLKLSQDPAFNGIFKRKATKKARREANQAILAYINAQQR